MINKDNKGDLQLAITSFKELSDNLDKRTAEISAGVNKLTATGTKEISVLVTDRSAWPSEGGGSGITSLDALRQAC